MADACCTQRGQNVGGEWFGEGNDGSGSRGSRGLGPKGEGVHRPTQVEERPPNPARLYMFSEASCPKPRPDGGESGPNTRPGRSHILGETAPLICEHDETLMRTHLENANKLVHARASESESDVCHLSFCEKGRVLCSPQADEDIKAAKRAGGQQKPQPSLPPRLRVFSSADLLLFSPPRPLPP